MTSRVKAKLPPAMKLYSDVTNAIAAETGINKEIIKTVIRTLWPEISLRILEGQTFTMPGTFSVYVKEYPAFKNKMGCGPQAGNYFHVDAHKKLRFVESIITTIRLNPDNNYRKRNKKKYMEKVEKNAKSREKLKDKNSKLKSRLK